MSANKGARFPRCPGAEMPSLKENHSAGAMPGKLKCDRCAVDARANDDDVRRRR
jgi:hypothetical protein